MKKKSPKSLLLSETRRLLDVVHDLRTQCPWDKKQTHRSLVRYLLEEAYETIEAIEHGDSESLREELGDLLLQVALHAELASERKGGFGFEEVARGIHQKMVRRHPHIYGDSGPYDSKQHQKTWNQIKAKERPRRSLLEGIPRSMPALSLAQRYGEIAGAVGFDWTTVEGVLEKVDEELDELRMELRRKVRRKRDIEMELGDLLFTVAHVARHLKIDAEAALRKSALKFGRRFSELEARSRKKGRSLADCSAEELDREWEAIKTRVSKGHRIP